MKRFSIFILLSFMFGQCVAADNGLKIAEDIRKKNRIAQLASIDPKNVLIYRPEAVKGIVNIFTDLDCSYCKKLHEEIPRLMDLGIEVRYLAFPRHGAGSLSYTKMVSIWCAEDPKDVMTQAMREEELEVRHCEHTIDQQFALGRKLGVRGTPTLIFSDGTLWSGYLPATTLAKEAIKHSLKE